MTYHLFSHATARIFDKNNGLMLLLIYPVTNGNTAFESELSSVGYQVVEHLLQTVHVGTNYDAIPLRTIHQQLQIG